MPPSPFAAAWPPLWAKLNSQHPGLAVAEQRLRALVLFLVALCLYQGLTQGASLAASVRDWPRYPLECSGYLALFLLLPAATWALAQRKPLGWTLAVGYLTFSLLTALFGLWFGLWFALTWHPSGVAAFDALSPRRSLLPSLLSAAVFTGALVVLSQPDLRQAFRVSTRQLGQAVAAAVLLAIVVAVFR